ncbi:MAG: hypothetical protein AB7V27_03675 [Candidatus Binatia bacterium]
MAKKGRFLLLALAISAASVAAALTWSATERGGAAPSQAGEAVAPASRGIFPKVLNR